MFEESKTMLLTFSISQANEDVMSCIDNSLIWLMYNLHVCISVKVGVGFEIGGTVGTEEFAGKFVQ